MVGNQWLIRKSKTLGSHTSLASVTLETIRLTRATPSTASETDPAGVTREWRMDRETGTAAESRVPVVWALCWGNQSPSAAQGGCCTELNGEAWLLPMAKREGSIYGVQLPQGGGSS